MPKCIIYFQTHSCTLITTDDRRYILVIREINYRKSSIWELEYEAIRWRLEHIKDLYDL